MPMRPPPTLPDADDAPEPRYSLSPPGEFGIGKHFMGREISEVMGWRAKDWLDREERESEERTDLLLPLLGVQPGMVVADIGAGTGYLARRIAPLLRPAGRVLAVEVQPMLVRVLERLAAEAGLDNIEASRCRDDHVLLPPASVDVAVMLDVYHELSCPYEMLASVVQAVRPGGRVVFVEFKGEDPEIPIKALHKMTETRVRQEAALHRLEWESTASELPWQHVLVFRRAG